MKVIPLSIAAELPYSPLAGGKVQRLSCCCRISELMPLVRQLHDEARARAEARRPDTQQAA